MLCNVQANVKASRQAGIAFDAACRRPHTKAPVSSHGHDQLTPTSL